MNQQSQAPTPSPARGRLRRAASFVGLTRDVITATNVVVAGLAAAILVTWATGGWSSASAADESAAPEIPTVAVGTPVQARPYRLSVTAARTVEKLDGLLPDDRATRYLVIALDVTDTDARYVQDSMGMTGNGLDFDGLVVDAEGLVDGLTGKPIDSGAAQRPALYRVKDTQRAWSFQPGVPTPVIAVYQQSSSQPVPTKLTVTLHQYTWRKSALDNHLNWFDPTPVARVEVPVVAK